MPDTIAENFAHQQASHIPARVTGAEHPPTNARATRARSARPASVTLSRIASPAIRAPAFPAALVPGENHAGRADTHGDARPTGRHTSSPNTLRPGHPHPSSGYAHRSLAAVPVRYMSVECDVRSHIVSEMTDWRAEMIGGLSSG